ncbi:OLC1v1004997C1 [Oldenlandia corymbosa var. corymbosa]|uniref:OLC1v1004997C1 n=1 Tax=Oldenlandia corymbosa var. corymbosa TaxID=529605 RepID=A0AAV1DG18_OLDCO|nr:OLC1v1004997C1 [Oldenlandia corymbosa var. corymbosa]
MASTPTTRFLCSLFCCFPTPRSSSFDPLPSCSLSDTSPEDPQNSNDPQDNNLVSPLTPSLITSEHCPEDSQNNNNSSDNYKRAGLLVAFLCSAIGDLDWLMEQYPFDDFDSEPLQTLRYRLRTLKSFILSTETFDDDGSLGSLLMKIDSNTRGVAASIRRICFHRNGTPYSATWPFTMSWRIADLLDMIHPSFRDIDEWYLTMFHEDKLRLGSFPDLVVETISTFLDSLTDFHALWHCQSDFYKGIEAMGEKMTFLRGLIYFAIHRKQPIKDLVLHAEAVVTRAVYLLFNCRNGCMVVIEPMGMTLEISTFVQKVKLIEDVHQIYAQTLLCSKFPDPSLPPTHYEYMDVGYLSVAMVDILDYIISTLWKQLALDTCCAAPLKDQLRELFEGLRSLRKILKQHLAIFDDMENKEDVVALVCDAGVMIFSFHQKHVEQSHELQDLLQKIKMILLEYGEEVLQVPLLDLPKTNQLGFVDFILEKLSEFTSYEVEPIGKTCIQTIQEELVSLRFFLGEIEELRHTQPEVQALWDRILEVACKVEDFIDHLMVGDLSYSPSTSSFAFIVKAIEDIKADVLNAYPSKGGREMEVKEAAMTCYQKSSQRTTSIAHEVVGFVKERCSIMDRLTRGSQQLRIITIVGMPGVGKTTLARSIFNDPSIVDHFPVRAWSPVSQEVEKRKILLELLIQIDPDDSSYLKMTEDDLAEVLWRHLKRRRYLIFLDDVWDIKAWDNLYRSFPDDCYGSRIILTSRHFDVAPPSMLDQEPLIVSPLDKEDSWKLLQSRLFPPNGWTPALHDLGTQIAEKCKGLPLTIVIVAGILATMEPEGWNQVMDALSTGIVSITEHCQNTLELSFRHLPNYLKPCLLYFGAFQEDEEVSVRRLLCLWIAEGFAQKAETKRVQDVAEDYLNALIGRSLVTVSKKRWDGGVKACRIHDLIHEFCLQKAKDEQFLHILKGQDQLLAFNEPRIRRISIFGEAKHVKEAKLFCPRTRSLLINIKDKNDEYTTPQISLSIFVHIFKVLRILDLQGISVGSQFPRELELLVQLAFLRVYGEMTYVPTWIDKLSTLETLSVGIYGKILSLPSNLWNLRKLKFLGAKICCARIPLESLESSPVLYELDRFSCAGIPLEASIEKLMRKFPGIRRFKYTVLEEEDDKKDRYEIVVPEFLNQLQSLHVSSDRLSSYLRVHEICLPTHLKKLALTQFYLSSKSISMIGKLPNLEVLKLNYIEFEGNAWEMEEGEFLNLKMLKLCGSKLVEWRGYDDQFAQLQVLLLEACKELKEMPSCLESISTLETIEVTDCPKTVESLVRDIEEEQEKIRGDSSLRVIIRSRNLVTIVHH